ncbi:hypothetical protein [Roseiarcus fermentans]|nr:hypothetical protein [Roseiarcus fermentans]
MTAIKGAAMLRRSGARAQQDRRGAALRIMLDRDAYGVGAAGGIGNCGPVRCRYSQKRL